MSRFKTVIEDSKRSIKFYRDMMKESEKLIEMHHHVGKDMETKGGRLVRIHAVLMHKGKATYEMHQLNSAIREKHYKTYDEMKKLQEKHPNYYLL